MSALNAEHVFLTVKDKARLIPKPDEIDIRKGTFDDLTVESLAGGGVRNIGVDNDGNVIAGGAGGATSLSELDDVNITAPAAGELLSYDGTEWKNAPPAPIALNDLSDVDVVAPAHVQVLQYSTITGKWANSNIALANQYQAGVVYGSTGENGLYNTRLGYEQYDIGESAATGTYNVVVGSRAGGTIDDAPHGPMAENVFVGARSRVSSVANGGVAIGYDTRIENTNAIAIGRTANAAGTTTIALGSGSRASGTNNIALGTGATSTTGTGNMVVSPQITTLSMAGLGSHTSGTVSSLGRASDGSVRQIGAGAKTTLELSQLAKMSAGIAAPSNGDTLSYSTGTTEWTTAPAIVQATPFVPGTVKGLTSFWSTALGRDALKNETPSEDTDNVAIGAQSGQQITTADGNTAVGSYAMWNGMGYQNTCIGKLSGEGLGPLGHQNTLIGASANVADESSFPPVHGSIALGCGAVAAESDEFALPGSITGITMLGLASHGNYVSRPLTADAAGAGDNPKNIRGLGVGKTTMNLSQLANVSTAAPADGNSLVYNSTASIWEPAGGGGGGSVPEASPILSGRVYGITGDETGPADRAANTALGFHALAGMTDLSVMNNNVCVGNYAAASAIDGSDNVIAGNHAAISSVGMNFGVLVGANSAPNTSGPLNTVVGYNAGADLGGEGRNTLIGANSDIVAGVSNSVAIGEGAVAANSNEFAVASVVDAFMVAGLGTHASTPATTLVSQNTATGVIRKLGTGKVTMGLSQLSNVSVTAPSDGQILAYNSGASAWGPVTGGGGGGTAPDAEPQIRGVVFGHTDNGPDGLGVGENVALGFAAMDTGTGMSANVMVGYQAGKDMHDSSGNVVIGAGAAVGSDTAFDNVIIGTSAAAGELFTGESCVVVGNLAGQTLQSGTGNVCVGAGADAGATSANITIVGAGATTVGNGGVAVGSGASVAAANNMALGTGANASGAANAIAIGANSVASGSANAIAVGTGATASGSTSVAIGAGATANGATSIALGAGVTAAAGELAVPAGITAVKVPGLAMRASPVSRLVTDSAGLIGTEPFVALSSGSYTPTITGIGTSVWYNFTLQGAYYIRTGNIVTGNTTFWCTPTGSATNPFEITLTLPVAPTVAFGASGESRLVGQCTLTEIVGSGRVNVGLAGYTGNLMRCQAGTTFAANSGSNYRISCSYSYTLA